MSKSEKRSDTVLAETGRRPEWTLGVVNPPVYHASTVLFHNHAALRRAIANSEDTFFYARKGTPTIWSFAEAVAELEGAAGGKVFPSGIAAVTTALLSSVKAGDHLLLADSVYEPVRFIAKSFLRRLGVEADFFDPLIGAGIADLMRENTTTILLESPGSLTFEFQDLPAIAKVAKEHDATVIVDNTWATPLFHRPLEHGADVVVHAATKYLAGHSDVMLGVVVANDAKLKALQRATAFMGQVTGPDDAYLGLRGLRTLAVRLRQHEKNGLVVAKWLADHEMVHQVLHPAFEDCPGHDIWKRDFTGANGLFSIVLKAGDYENVAHFVDGLEHFGIGFSWGGFESLILPQDPTAVRSAHKWEAPGPLVRLHIGLEDPADLIEDLDAGLKRFADALG